LIAATPVQEGGLAGAGLAGQEDVAAGIADELLGEAKQRV
jgi:hypothetical protein